MSADTQTLKSRYVVKLVTEWMGGATHCLIEPWNPEFKGEDDDDPVENMLFELAADASPSDFHFKPSRRVDHLEGAEFVIEDKAKRLRVGSVIEIAITVIGHQESE